MSVRPSVYFMQYSLRMDLKEFLQHSKGSIGVLGQAHKQASKEASKEASKQAS